MAAAAAAAGASEQLAALGVDLSKVPDAQGSLVCDIDGTVIEATGELEGAAGEAVAATLFQMLQDAGTILEHSRETMSKASFRRMTVTFSEEHYVITIAAAKIVIVKRSSGSAA